MTTWRSYLQVRSGVLKLLVVNGQGEALLKARLPERPHHPRAVVTLLEGMALHSGAPLCAVIDATGYAGRALGSDEYFDEWPAQSALVRFEFAHSCGHGRGQKGLGDFGQLHRMGRVRT